jgi:hypothetical protein
MHKVIFILICINLFYFSGYSENIDININSEPVKCYGESSGKITITIISGEPEFTVRLYNDKPSSRQKCLAKVSTGNTHHSFDKLPADHYYITIEDSEGDYIEKEITLEEPEKLKADPITLEKCFTTPENNDAILRANCSGGTEPYTYLWSENTGNQTTQLAENISPGIYRCFINDRYNCGEVSATVFFDKKFFKECFPDSE